MPEATVAEYGWALVAAEGEGAGYAIGTFLIDYSTAISVGLVVAGTYAVQERAKRKAREAYNASQVDRLSSVVASTSVRHLVLGEVRKGGTVIFRDSTSTNNSKFVMVVALAAHEINSVKNIYFNDTVVSLDSNGYVSTAPWGSSSKTTVTVEGQSPTLPSNYVANSKVTAFDEESGNWYTTYQVETVSSKARVRWKLGTENQEADSRLMELFPNKWTSAFKLQGIAYLILEYDYDETAFAGGMPSVTAQIEGAKVYDPRSGIAAYSNNPALLARHIVTHSYFGKRSSLTATEEARLIAAANACDTSYTPIGGTATKLYRASLVVEYGTTAASVLDDLCQAMNGMWAYAGGECYIKAGVYAAPVKELTYSDLATEQTDSQGGIQSLPISINVHKARADKFNTVTATIWDADKDFLETPLSSVKNTEAITKDGKELPLPLKLAAVSSAAQAAVICNYYLKDSFDPLSLTLTFKLSAYTIELFESIYLTIPRYGFNAKEFLVIGKTFSPTGTVELTLKETSSAIYNPLLASNSQGLADNTTLSKPWEIYPPAIVSISSGTSELIKQSDGSIITRVKVSWSPITDSKISQAGYVEVYWQKIGDSSWTSVTAAGNETSLYIYGTEDSSTILLKARTRSSLAVSDWSVQQGHKVVGKTERPSNVVGSSITLSKQILTLKFGAISDLDFAGYEVRLQDENWGSSGELFRGDASSISANPTDVHTVYYVKAYDRSGIYSEVAEAISYTKADIPKPDTANVTVVDHTLKIEWTQVNPDFGLGGYEVRELDIDWGKDTGILFRGPNLSCSATPAGVGISKTWFIRAYDKYGTYSSSTSVSYTTPNVSDTTDITSDFSASSISNNIVTLSWPSSNPTFGLSGYSLSYTGKTISTKEARVTLAVDWVGARYFTVKTIDSYGNISSGYSKAVVVSVPGSVQSMDTNIIDGSLVLSWLYPSITTLPIAGIEVREDNFNWGSLGAVFKGDALNTVVMAPTIGYSKTWYARVYDTSGAYGPSVLFSYSAAQIPNISSIFVDFSSTSLTSSTVTLSWTDVTPEFGLSGYRIVYDNETVVSNSNRINVPANWIGNKTFTVYTVDRLNNNSSGYTQSVTISSPNGVSNFAATVSDNAIKLSWMYPARTSLPIAGVEIRSSNSGWGSGSELFKGDALSVSVKPPAAGNSTTWYAKVFDTSGNYGSVASVDYATSTLPEVGSITSDFYDTSLTSAQVTLTWAGVNPTFGLAKYILSYDSEVVSVSSNKYTTAADWLGNRAFKLQVVDMQGNVSTGYTHYVSKLAPAALSSFKAEVIDNNVLFHCERPEPTTLPIASVRLKKGVTWDTAEKLGDLSADFFLYQELKSGSNTYWAAVVDTDGIEGTPVSLIATVSEPPDFVFNSQYESTFSGTKTNAIVDSGALFLNVDTSETYQGHFTSRGWSSPQDQVNAGFPYWIQPGSASSAYVEVFDYGTVLGSSNITVDLNGTAVSGSNAVAITISVSLDGVVYTDYIGYTSLFATNFRYIKVSIVASQSTSGAIYRVNSLTVTLDSKKKTDDGTADVYSTDSLGTIINFTKEFVDISAPKLTSMAVSPRLVGVDFKDAVISGTYTLSSGVCTINANAHGLVTGQKTRLSILSGGGTSGVYTLTGYTANSFTVAMSGSGSGNINSYANSMRVYLYDTSGNRVSGLVSWAVAGY